MVHFHVFGMLEHSAPSDHSCPLRRASQHQHIEQEEKQLLEHHQQSCSHTDWPTVWHQHMCERIRSN